MAKRFIICSVVPNMNFSFERNVNVSFAKILISSVISLAASALICSIVGFVISIFQPENSAPGKFPLLGRCNKAVRNFPCVPLVKITVVVVIIVSLGKIISILLCILTFTSICKDILWFFLVTDCYLIRILFCR